MRAVLHIGQLAGFANSVTSLSFGLMIVNLIILGLLTKANKLVFYTYAVLTTQDWWNWTIWITGFNFPIAWLTLLGLINPAFLILPILAKFPFNYPWPSGAWTYALSPRTPAQLWTYVPLVLLWLMIFSIQIRKKKAQIRSWARRIAFFLPDGGAYQ